MQRTMDRLAAEMQQLIGGPCRAVSEESLAELPCGFFDRAACAACPSRADPAQRTHQYGAQEASRWGGSYIYYCPKGLTFCALLGQTEHERLSGLILGPVILGETQDMLLEGESEDFCEGVRKLKAISPEQMNAISEIAALAAIGVACGQGGGEQTYDQADFLNELYDLRERQTDLSGDYSFILRAEDEMKVLVKNLDKPGAQKLLNELLGRIYLQSYYDLDEVRTRCVELIVVLSRTVVDAGVEMGRIFHFSTEFLRQAGQLQTIDALCAWMSDVLHSFIDAVFSFAGIKHADAVYKTMNYIRSNWRDKPPLEEIARHVYLSKSYLSMLFKQETGVGISEFINQVRIEHSKKLLATTDMSIAAIAGECCFHDQSYYTKVFQKTVGLSPKKYRDKQK